MKENRTSILDTSNKGDTVTCKELPIAEAIQEHKAKIQELCAKIASFESDPDDFIQEFNDLLDEQEPVIVSGITFSPSRILKELDDIAYNVYLGDYVSNKEIKDDPKYKKLCDELEQEQAYLIKLQGRI